MRHRYNSQLAFNDMLSNMLLGFVLLFVLAFFLMNPITKKADVPTKAEIMIIFEWDNKSADDLDIWIIGPDMEYPLSFQNKTSGYMHLDRDDLGKTSDTIVVNGKRTYISINREVVNMRGIAPGDYFINIHAYARSKSASGPTEFTLTLLDVNPYREIYNIQGKITKRGEVVKLPAFTVNDEGDITDVFVSDTLVSRISKPSATGRDPEEAIGGER